MSISIIKTGALVISALVLFAACENEPVSAPPQPAVLAPAPPPPSHPSAIAVEAPRGGLDAALFLRVMDKRKSSFRVCYGKALLRSPGVSGRLNLRLSIAPSGRVGTVEVQDSAPFDAELAACVTRVLRRVEFPALPAGHYTTVEFPLRFSP